MYQLQQQAPTPKKVVCKKHVRLVTITIVKIKLLLSLSLSLRYTRDHHFMETSELIEIPQHIRFEIIKSYLLSLSISLTPDIMVPLLGKKQQYCWERKTGTILLGKASASQGLIVSHLCKTMKRVTRQNRFTLLV